MLVAENLVSAAGVEEALESQVVHGGRLGTNLVELGLVQEKDLARVLGKLHNAAFASGEMTPDKKALELIDPNFADQKDILPMRVDQTRISLAVVNPRDIETLDAVGFKTGKRVMPVVIPEFRMNQLLRRYCKAFRTLRAIDMNAVRPSKTLKADAAEEPKAADLMSEDEFQTMYAKALTGGAASDEEAITGELVEETQAPPAPMVVLPSAPQPPPARPGPPVLDAAPPPVQPPPLPAEPPPPTPLTFAEAQGELGKSSDREQIAHTVLRFAIGKWKRALLLSVNGPLVTGWRGMGVGVRERAVQRVGVALRGQSTFKLVCETRAHHVGPMKRDAGTAVFYKLLGGGYPKTAVLLPLLVRGKVVHVLYVDNGPNQYTPPDVGELLILAQAVGRSYEVLMRRRKSA